MQISNIWRYIRRSRRLKLFLALSVFIVVLVIVLSYVEKRSNEHFNSIFDVLYFAMVTITTVGYGDITPVTDAGKILTVLLFSIGVVLIGLMTGMIASILTASRIREGMGLKKVELKSHVIICGYNFNLERVIGAQVDGAYVLPASALAGLAGEKVLTVGLDRPVTVLQDGRERAYDKTMVVMAEELPGLFTPSEAGGWDNTTVQEGIWRAVLGAAAERPEGEREAAADALAAASGSADAAPLAELVQGLTKGDAAVARMPSTSRVAEGQFAFVPDQERIMAAVTRKGSGYSSPYTVVIRNGSGKVGIGTAVAERLAVLDVNLPQPTNADRFNYRRTRILVGDGAVTVGEDIRAILGRGVVLKGGDVPANTVVVIVGDDVTPADLKPKDQQ